MAIGIYVVTLLIIPTLFVLFKIIPYVRKTWLSSIALKQFPMEEYHWFFGHLLTHPGPTHEGFLTNNEWTAKHPRYFGFFWGPLRPVLALNHPETVKELAKTAEPKSLSGGGGYSLLYPWIGDGLLLSYGKKWHRNRKLLTPGFHFDVLKPYIKVYNQCVEKLMDVFENKSCTPNKSIDIYTPVSLCTLDIILRCAFSSDKDIQGQGEDEPYVKTVNSLSELIIERALRPHLYFDTLFYNTKRGKEFKRCCDFSHEYANLVINERKKALANKQKTDTGNNRYVDFLDILLLARDEAGNGLSDSEIRDEVETFMFEGHDTTASAISWILYNLSRHVAFQDKARKEVDALLSDRDNDMILWDDLTELPYLTMCIKESLRLHPPVPVISRETTKPFVVDGKVLPPGSFVDILIWNVHHNPTVWEDPLTYNPDRFTPERMKHMDSHAFIPFSAGPRNCIGQNFAMHEIKVAMAKIIHRFKLTLDESTEVRIKPHVVLRAENGIHILFHKRS